MSWRRHLRVFAKASEPDAGDVGRLARRVTWARAIVKGLPAEPAPGAEARLAARLRGPRRRERRVVPLLAGVALVAAALLFWLLPARLTVLDHPLSASLPITEALTDEVRAVYSGSGRAQGTSAAPRLRWEVGTLTLDVAPHRGIDLRVETEEAVVTVVGTRFTVTRDALGTAVHVEHGEVAVRCATGPSLPIRAGEGTLCLPRHASGMLTRARQLVDRGAPSDEVLDAVARGLALAPAGDPAAGELLALRIEVLLQLGRVDEARADARRYLALGGPRREEVEAVLDALGPAEP